MDLKKMGPQSFVGKTIIVTGASQGIGRAEAELLVMSGANVVFTDIDDVTGLEVVRDLGGTAIYLHHDVSKSADWKNVMEQTLNKFGRIDGLVNNAGIYIPSSIDSATEEDFQKMIAINQLGTFLGIKFTSEVMKQNGGGAIVNTSSICGIRGLEGCIGYVSTKWAIRGMTKTAASELGKYNIRVNAVLPGFIDTRIIAVNTPEMNEQSIRDTAIGRMGQPDDIASVVKYLLSEESSFITGADFLSDGGWSL